MSQFKYADDVDVVREKYLPPLNRFPTFDRSETCCFTGHRSIPEAEKNFIIRRLDDIIGAAIRTGYVNFISGGAIGFDQLAAERILHAKRTYSHIKLAMSLPCRDQCNAWTPEQIHTYKEILGQADFCEYLQDFYSNGCMLARDRYMVDLSSLCICFYNGSKRGGTAYTVRYAAECGLRIVGAGPDSYRDKLLEVIHANRPKNG